MNCNKLGWCLIACVASHAVYAEDAPAAADFEYQVKVGDNLGKLSGDLLDSPARWGEVARYNKLHDANLIHPKQILHIPLAWLKNFPAQARIEALLGEVRLNGRVAHPGDAVATGDKLETASAASVRMSLPDGSTLNMLEATQLQAQNLQQKQQGNFFYAVFRLVTGRIDALKRKYPEGQAPLRIEAMHGTIGVRGTHFRMGQEGENTIAEIEQGLVGFEAGTASLALACGQGSVADGVHAPIVMTLLHVPTFPDLTENFAPDKVSFVMQYLAGAKAYRGELASDEDFKQIIANVSADGSAISITGLGEGSYWLRLRAVDEHGLQGLQAQTVLRIAAPPVVVPPPPPSDFPIISPSKPIVSAASSLSGWPQLKGFQYELQIAKTADFARIIQGVRLRENFFRLPNLPTGGYFIRLRLLDAANRVGPWCEPVGFTTE